MRTVPRFLHGVYRFAMCQALDVVKKGHEDRNELMQIRGWKHFFLVPRLLHFRLGRSGLVPGSSWRTEWLFQNGEWDVLLEKSLDSSLHGATRMSVTVWRVEKRARRAFHMVQLGEVSAGRQALEGASLALGDTKTLAARKDPNRRPDEIEQFAVVEEFVVARDLFLANVRTARRGAAPGLSGMAADHVRPLGSVHSCWHETRCLKR